jgi:hypothetical protein
MATTTETPTLDPDAPQPLPARRRWAAARPLPRMLQDVRVTLDLPAHVHELLSWWASMGNETVEDYVLDLVLDQASAIVSRASAQGCVRPVRQGAGLRR